MRSAECGTHLRYKLPLEGLWQAFVIEFAELLSVIARYPVHWAVAVTRWNRRQFFRIVPPQPRLQPILFGEWTPA